jgi:hypothetical protein
LGGREGPGASGQPPRTSQGDERRARQKRAWSVALGDEIKIQLRQYTLSDPYFRLGDLDRNRHRSIGRAFDHFEESELWMEYSSQSEDRRQNGRQRRAGTPLRSLCAGGASCTDGLCRADLLRLSADVDGSECAARANVCIRSNMAGFGPRCSGSIGPAVGAVVLGCPFTGRTKLSSGEFAILPKAKLARLEP